MIFAHTLEQVLDGTKTQTRRLVKPGDILFYEPDSVIRNPGVNQRVIYEVGKDYAVCPGRGKSQVARIRVLDLKHEDVRSISAEDAKAEGWWYNPIRQEYMADPVLWYLRLWASMYDTQANVRMGQLKPDYWRGYLIARPERYWLAWAITFERVKEGS